MKLAEALILRADSKKRIEQLKTRLARSSKVQEGGTPPENPQELLAELERIAQEMVTLIQRINRTNAATQVEPGVSLADALATRDLLDIKLQIYRDLAQTASVTQDIRTRSEVRYIATVEVARIQSQADQIAKTRRELDTVIQALNWSTDLM